MTQQGYVHFSPYRFSSRLVLYINPLITGSITKDGSNKVSQINDLSGKGNHLYQGLTVNQFTYNTTLMNGLASLSGDGANTYMATTNDIDTTAGFSLIYVFINKSRKNFNGHFGIKTAISANPAMDFDWPSGSTDANSGTFNYAANRQATERYMQDPNVGSAVNTPVVCAFSATAATSFNLIINGFTRTPSQLGSGTTLIPSIAAKAFLGFSYGTAINSTYVGHSNFGALALFSPALSLTELNQMYQCFRTMYRLNAGY